MYFCTVRKLYITEREKSYPGLLAATTFFPSWSLFIFMEAMTPLKKKNMCDRDSPENICRPVPESLIARNRKFVAVLIDGYRPITVETVLALVSGKMVASNVSATTRLTIDELAAITAHESVTARKHSVCPDDLLALDANRRMIFALTHAHGFKFIVATRPQIG